MESKEKFEDSGAKLKMSENGNVVLETDLITHGGEIIIDRTKMIEEPVYEARHYEMGKLLYEAYGDKVNWRNHKGAFMPMWENLGDKLHRAWVHVALTGIGIGMDIANQRDEEADQLYKPSLWMNLLLGLQYVLTGLGLGLVIQTIYNALAH